MSIVVYSHFSTTQGHPTHCKKKDLFSLSCPHRFFYYIASILRLLYHRVRKFSSYEWHFIEVAVFKSQTLDLSEEFQMIFMLHTVLKVCFKFLFTDKCAGNKGETGKAGMNTGCTQEESVLRTWNNLSSLTAGPFCVLDFISCVLFS